MRAATTLALIAAGAALLLSVTGPGAGAEDPLAGTAAETGPRHQILGSWKLGRRGHLRLSQRGGRVSGRAARAFRFNGCRIPRGTLVFRAYRFDRRKQTSDIWVGRVLRPGRACARRYARSRIAVLSDLRLTELSRRGGRTRARRLRRIRPHVRSNDPVLGTWERMGGGVSVTRRGGAYYGTARQDFLISNGCRVPAGTVIWRLRPSAPGRYDGVTQTFLPPPTCDPGAPSPSRWRLESEAQRLVREAPDGTLAVYQRAR